MVLKTPKSSCGKVFGRFLLIMLSLALLISAAACGGNSEKGGSEGVPDATDTAPAETPTETPEPTPEVLSPDEAYDIEVSYPITERSVDAINPQNYIAVDGLGRTVSTAGSEYSSSLLKGTVGSTKNQEKFVGIFYSSWHEELAKSTGIRNVTAIMNALESDEAREKAKHDYNDPAWKKTGGYHFWDEPVFNYYSTADKYVIRKHAELLADAGIDCIILDNTNGRYTWETSYMALFEGFSAARKEGVNAPGIVFMLNFGPGEDTRFQLNDIYDKLYKKGLYQDTWFYWEGKPLILAYPESLDTSGSKKDREIYNFFTFKRNDASYFRDERSSSYWGWLSIYPQAVYKDANGKVEEITVGVAQNADYKRNCITAMSGYNVMGRSYTKGKYSYTYKYNGETITVDKNIENSKFYGLNFQQQWDYAIKQDPEFIFVTGWNEWVAIRSETWAGDTTLTNTMVDQYDTEYSRDCEPSLGVMKDYYYYQLVENVRRFKGVSDTTAVSPMKTINVFGRISQWNDVPATETYVGSTIQRSKPNGSKAYGGKVYRSDTARNDVAAVKTAYDSKYIYFYAECANEITPSTDEGWMRLLIDIGDSSASWEGFEFVINRLNPNDGKASVERSKGGWTWESCGSADVVVNRNIIQIRVERSDLGLSDGNVPASFGYKWTDNNLFGDTEGDILSLYRDGEAAPGGRFCFVFKG